MTTLEEGSPGPCPDAIARTAIETVWGRLQALSRLRFSAHCAPHSQTRWRGTGWATVAAQVDTDSCTLHEQGHFAPAGHARRVPFVNVYRWRRMNATTLRLSHQRLGREALLFDLVARDACHLVCAAPHACGADRYHGLLTLTGAGLCLRWSIAGPRKAETLLCLYRP